MKEVASGVYVETRYAGGNVGCILTGVGVVCVDTPMMPAEAGHWLSRIRKVTDEPIISAVQTAYDRGRVLSTGLLDAPVIAHEAAWERMTNIYIKERNVEEIRDLLGQTALGRDWRVRMPDITFTERLTLKKGSRDIHIVHGGGHSPATCMVHLPEDRLIFSGDVVSNNEHPTMEEAQTQEWLSALTRLRRMAVDTIVPGHGNVCGKASTYPLSDYVRSMRAKVRSSFGAGRSKSETSKAIIAELLGAFPCGEDESRAVCERIKGGSDRIYDECRTATKERSEWKAHRD